MPLTDGAIGTLWVVRNAESPWSLLYFHGNGEDLHDVAHLIRLLARHATVYAVDYRGYGRSTGTPSVRTFEADARAFYDEAIRLGADPNHLIVQGYSLGGAAAVEVASSRPVAGLLLCSTFTSLLGVPSFGWLLPGDWLRSEEKLSRVSCPVTVCYGTADTLIPPSHGERLFAAANAPKRLLRIADADHISAHRYDAEYFRNFLDWLAVVSPSPKPMP